MNGIADRDLVARAVAGEEQAWREIYDRTRDRLFALLSYQLGNREEALDVLQETYLHAIRNIRQFRGEGSLESWMAVIAIRRCVDWKRRFLAKIKRTAPLDEARTVAEEDPPNVHFTSESKALGDSLSKLSDRQRTALLLRELQGLSFQEIGEALGCNEATARVHHHRAKERMQMLLRPDVSRSQALCAEE